MGFPTIRPRSRAKLSNAGRSADAPVIGPQFIHPRPQRVSLVRFTPRTAAALALNSKRFATLLARPAIHTDPEAAIDRARKDTKPMLDEMMGTREIDYPRLPFFSKITTSGLFQYFKMLVGAFNDSRTLAHADACTTFTALGTMFQATQRAIARAEKDNGAPAEILDIGSGQRLIPYALKSLFGGKIVTHEVSPKYSDTKNAIDVEHEPARIDEAVLPKEWFQLAYSFYGSIYGHDQALILDKVVSSLKEGGEALLMWTNSQPNKALMSLITGNRDFLLKQGVAITITTTVEDTYKALAPKLHWVHVQKLRSGIDMAGLLDDAALAPVDPDRHIRLSLAGPHVTIHSIPREKLLQLACDTVSDFLSATDMIAGDALYKLSDMRKDDATAEDVAKFLMKELDAKELFAGTPLTSLLLGQLYETYRIKGSKDSIAKRRERIFHAMTRR